MQKLNQKIISIYKYYFKGQFIAFFIVGVSAFVVDLATLFLQINILNFNPNINLISSPQLTINLYIANIFAVIAGLTFGFFLNKHWTFKEKEGNTGKQLGKYYLVSIINLVINNLIYGALVPIGVSPFIAKVIATFIQMFSSFALYKIVVFKV